MSRADSVFDGAETASEYQARVLRKRVSPSATKGADHKLPGRYAKRNGEREADVLKACRDVLRAHGVWSVRLEGIGKIVSSAKGAMMVPGDMAGMPDLLSCVNGRLIALEVKAPGGTLSALQYAKLLAIQRAGGLSLVVCDAASLSKLIYAGWKLPVDCPRVGGEIAVL